MRSGALQSNAMEDLNTRLGLITHNFSAEIDRDVLWMMVLIFDRLSNA